MFCSSPKSSAAGVYDRLVPVCSVCEEQPATLGRDYASSFKKRGRLSSNLGRDGDQVLPLAIHSLCPIDPIYTTTTYSTIAAIPKHHGQHRERQQGSTLHSLGESIDSLTPPPCVILSQNARHLSPSYRNSTIFFTQSGCLYLHHGRSRD